MTVTGNIIGYRLQHPDRNLHLDRRRTGASSRASAFNGITGGTVSNINNNTMAAVSLTGVTSAGTGSSAPRSPASIVTNGLATRTATPLAVSRGRFLDVLHIASDSALPTSIGILNFSVDDWTANSNSIGGISVTNLGRGRGKHLRHPAHTSIDDTVTQRHLEQRRRHGGELDPELTRPAPASQVTGICLSSKRNRSHRYQHRPQPDSNSGTGTTTAASVIGIGFTSATPNHTATQNTIFNLRNTQCDRGRRWSPASSSPGGTGQRRGSAT